jgi:hypothetical protein
VLGHQQKSRRGQQEERNCKALSSQSLGVRGFGALSIQPARRPLQAALADFFFSWTADLSDLEYHHFSRPNTVKMAPKKAAVRAPQENISLGPQVREGKNPHIRQRCDTRTTHSSMAAKIASRNMH